MNHVGHLKLADKASHRCFTLFPIHLFWGGEPQTQRIYFYHYLLLFNEIKNRSERSLPTLSTQDWRSDLGDTYWKKQWPRPDGNNPSAFDPDAFWKYGALVFLVMSGVPTSLRGVITPRVGWLVDATSIWPRRTTPIFARKFYIISTLSTYTRKSGKWYISCSRPPSRSNGKNTNQKSRRSWRCGTHQGATLIRTSFASRKCGGVGFGQYATL